MWVSRALALGVGCAVVVAVGRRPADTAPSECASPVISVRAARDTTDVLRLRLNVPAYRLDVIEHGRVSRSIPVAVGQPKYRTPLGQFRLDYVVWNPWWRPPDSYWARRERPQAPGWSNPVGRVKLHVTGLVFLHGTPLEDSRGTAASHACVRMSNADAIALARLVHQYAGPDPGDALLDSLVADTSRTQTVALARTVPVDIEYRIAEVHGDTLSAYPDIYYRFDARGAERELLIAMVEAGIDTTDVARDSVRALARASRRAPARMLMSHLVRDARGHVSGASMSTVCPSPCLMHSPRSPPVASARRETKSTPVIVRVRCGADARGMPSMSSTRPSRRS